MRVWITGLPGIGKSTAIAYAFGEALVIETDRLYRGLGPVGTCIGVQEYLDYQKIAVRRVAQGIQGFSRRSSFMYCEASPWVASTLGEGEPMIVITTRTKDYESNLALRFHCDLSEARELSRFYVEAIRASTGSWISPALAALLEPLP